MDREEEIEIIISHLTKEVKKCSISCNSQLVNTIVRNGKLIEKYREEYKELKKTA